MTRLTSSLPLDECVSMICTRVHLGNGDGTFTEISTNVANRSLYSVPPPAYSLTRDSLYADVDGDGAVDLVGMTRRYSNSPPGWRSRGDGNFDALPIAFDCLVPVDFNGDLKADCVTGATLLTNNGTPSAQATANYNLSTQQLFWYSYPFAGSVPIDINGDGRHDILRWRDDPAQNVVFVSNGDGTFTQSSSFNLNIFDYALQSSDGNTAFSSPISPVAALPRSCGSRTHRAQRVNGLGISCWSKTTRVSRISCSRYNHRRGRLRLLRT